jgi:hypothetical protein
VVVLGVVFKYPTQALFLLGGGAVLGGFVVWVGPGGRPPPATHQ